MNKGLILKSFIILLIFSVLLTLIGCNKKSNDEKSSNEKTITYTKYTERGISYEVPREMFEAEGDNANFKLAVNESMTDDTHDYFFKTYILEMYSSMNLRKVDVVNSGNGKHEIYVYEGNVDSADGMHQVNIAGIGYNDAIYVYVFIWDDFYTSDEIFPHFLNSIE